MEQLYMAGLAAEAEAAREAARIAAADPLAGETAHTASEESRPSGYWDPVQKRSRRKSSPPRANGAIAGIGTRARGAGAARSASTSARAVTSRTTKTRARWKTRKTSCCLSARSQ